MGRACWGPGAQQGPGPSPLHSPCREVAGALLHRLNRQPALPVLFAPPANNNLPPDAGSPSPAAVGRAPHPLIKHQAA
jgi:hypothetical protein